MMMEALAADDDWSLIRRSAEGDLSAFNVILVRYDSDLRGFCRRFSQDPHDLADLQQEAALKAWRACGSFDARSSVRTWLYRIVANTAIDEYRRRMRRPQPVAELPEPRLASSSHESTVAELDALRHAMSRLPEHFRIVVTLAYGHGWAYPDIAEVCDISVATVRTRLSRARVLLRTFLAEDDHV